MTKSSSVSSLAHDVTVRLRAEILSGTRPPGSRLVERELAESYGVSRVPVREAIQQLRRDGLVDLSSTRRAAVREHTPDEIEELYVLREVLEGAAARLAAMKRTDKQISALWALHNSYIDDFRNGDHEGGLAKTGLWHQLLLEASNSPAALATMKPIEQRVQWTLLRNHGENTLIAEHQAILEAIEARDGEKAEQLTRAHTRTGRRIVIAGIGVDDPSRLLGCLPGIAPGRGQ